MTTQDSTRGATDSIDAGPRGAEQLGSGEHVGDRATRSGSGDQRVDTRTESSGTADEQLATDAQQPDADAMRRGGAERSASTGSVTGRTADSTDMANRTGTDSVAGSQSGAGSSAEGQGASALITADRARSYQERWNELKGQFVDDPRHAVRHADGLVGDVLDELEEVFRRQRGELERGLDDDRSSTEDLRLALGRYREFFDRLLSF